MYKLDLNNIHPMDRPKWQASYEEYNALYKTRYDIAHKIQPKIICEIGVRMGYSALAFLQAAPKAFYVGYDNYQGEHGGCSREMGLVWASKILSEYDHIINPACDTQKTTSLLLGGDFFHVDADHSFDGCTHDMGLAVNAGAEWILVDDYYYIRSVKEAADDFVKKHNLKATTFKNMRGQILIETKGEK
jgi:hypothetical protein